MNSVTQESYFSQLYNELVAAEDRILIDKIEDIWNFINGCICAQNDAIQNFVAVIETLTCEKNTHHLGAYRILNRHTYT